MGFDPAAPANGLGLDGMRERAAILEGRLEVTSRPGGGTTVELYVPLPAQPFGAMATTWPVPGPVV